MRTAVGLPLALTSSSCNADRPLVRSTPDNRWSACVPRRIDTVDAALGRVREGHHGDCSRRQPRVSGGFLWGMTYRDRRSFKSNASITVDFLLAPHPALALAAGMCFDPSCQESMDRIFLLVVSLPLLALAAAVAWTYRPYKEQEADGRKAFRDPETGLVFEGEPGVSPERDRKGELAYRAVSYTPWPVEAGAPGDRLRVNVGPVGQRVPRTFIFKRILPQPSEIIAVTLPRPFGIVFEEDKRKQRVVVESLIEGSVAYKLARKAKLDGAAWAVMPGDVLRACTCTNFVYQGVQSMVGLAAPQRAIVLYGADNQRWPKVMDALRKGDKSDGEVTLVVERRVERPQKLVTDEQAKFDY